MMSSGRSNLTTSGKSRASRRVVRVHGGEADASVAEVIAPRLAAEAGRGTAFALVFLATTGCARVLAGHGSVAETANPDFYPTKLSHHAVEQFIEHSPPLSAPRGVICNQGRDFLLTVPGASFTCSAPGGRVFTVTITDPDRATYIVR